VSEPGHAHIVQYSISVDGALGALPPIAALLTPPVQTLDGSGIGDFENSLQGLVVGLNSSEHIVTVTNIVSGSTPTFFDLDACVHKRLLPR